MIQMPLSWLEMIYVERVMVHVGEVAAKIGEVLVIPSQLGEMLSVEP